MVRSAPSSTIATRRIEGKDRMDPRQLQELMARAQQQAQALQAKLEQTVVEGSAGGGAVTIKMNGKKRVLKVTIEPETAKSGDIEMLQDLVLAALNEADRKADDAVKSSLGGMLGGMGLPGMF
jgi:nucleoid-associated protein EbfC